MITWSSLSVNEKKQALARPAMANSQQLKKTVGDIIARVEAEGDAAVRTLKSFITPGALKTLSDFGREQLGFNAIYKESLTK